MGRCCSSARRNSRWCGHRPEGFFWGFFLFLFSSLFTFLKSGNVGLFWNYNFGILVANFFFSRDYREFRWRFGVILLFPALSASFSFVQLRSDRKKNHENERFFGTFAAVSAHGWGVDADAGPIPGISGIVRDFLGMLRDFLDAGGEATCCERLPIQGDVVAHRRDGGHGGGSSNRRAVHIFALFGRKIGRWGRQRGVGRRPEHSHGRWTRKMGEIYLFYGSPGVFLHRLGEHRSFRLRHLVRTRADESQLPDNRQAALLSYRFSLAPPPQSSPPSGWMPALVVSL